MKENLLSESQMFLENESKYSFEETIQLLPNHIALAGWKITSIHDMQATLKKNGKEVLPIQVFELCNPVYAGELLQEDDLRIFSPMMPCRLSVYRKQDGKTYLARMNSALMAAAIGGKVEEVMAKAFSDIEIVLYNFIAD